MRRLYQQSPLYVLVAFVVLIGTTTLAQNKKAQQVTPTTKKPSFSAQTSADTAPLIFSRGERLAYTATLNDLPAGEGELLLRSEKREGQVVYRFTAQARSNELVDYLYRRRDTAEAVFSAATYTPVFFQIRSKENDRQREYGVQYDPRTQTLIGQVKRRQQTKERTLPAGTVYDPVSALYLLRSRDFQQGATLETEVFTGRSHYRVLARIVGKELIDLSSGQRPAIRLHPQVFSLDKNSLENLLPAETALWVTPDATHTPLKIESYHPLGRVVVELHNRER